MIQAIARTRILVMAIKTMLRKRVQTCTSHVWMIFVTQLKLFVNKVKRHKQYAKKGRPITAFTEAMER